MTGYYELLSGSITALLLLMYAALLCVLCRMIFRWFHTQKIAPLIPDAGILLLICVLLSILTDYQRGITTDVLSVGPAAVCGAVLGPILIVYAVEGICRAYRCQKNELSPWSIKQATDDLPEGICFADPEGRVILCNRRMRELAITLMGSDLQTIGELEAALQNPEKNQRRGAFGGYSGAASFSGRNGVVLSDHRTGGTGTGRIYTDNGAGCDRASREQCPAAVG